MEENIGYLMKKDMRNSVQIIGIPGGKERKRKNKCGRDHCRELFYSLEGGSYTSLRGQKNQKRESE